MKFTSFLLTICFLFHSANFLYGNPQSGSLIGTISTLPQKEQVDILIDKCWELRSKNPTLAIKYGLLALDKMEGVKSGKQLSTALNFLGVIYGNLGKLDSAYYYYNEAIQVAMAIDDSIEIAYSYNNLGDYYFKNALFSIALEYIFNAYDIFEKKGDKRGMAYTLNDIGEVYLKQKDYDKALEYFLRSGKLRLSRNDDRGYAKSLINQAATYVQLGKLNEAMEIYNEAFKYSERAGYIKGKSWVMAGIGNVYAKRKDFDKALENRFAALEIDLTIGNKYGEIINYNQIGSIYIQKGLKNKAEEYLQKAIFESKKTGHRDQLMISYDLLRNLALSYGDYKNAYDYFENFEAIEDSIFSQESSNKIADLQTAFLTERKIRENDLLKKDIEFEKQTRNYLILISLLVTGAVLLFISKFRLERKSNRELNDANQQLSELNAQKDKIFSIIGHDLKNPAGAIQNFLQFLHFDYDKITENEKKELIKSGYESSKRLTDQLVDLLEWGKVNRGIIDVNIGTIKLDEVIDEIVQLLSPLAKKKNIKIHVENCNTEVEFDRNMLSTSIRNLLNNSIKFTPQGGAIFIKHSLKDGSDFITIEDNGIGIEPDDLNNLFKIDKSTSRLGTDNETGTGLGLPITKEFVEKCGDEIFAKSNPGKGSTFTIKLKRKSV